MAARAGAYCRESISIGSDEIASGIAWGMNKDDTIQLPEIISPASSIYSVMNPASI
jgi:hypothetical protein